MGLLLSLRLLALRWAVFLSTEMTEGRQKRKLDCGATAGRAAPPLQHLQKMEGRHVVVSVDADVGTTPPGATGRTIQRIT